VVGHPEVVPKRLLVEVVPYRAFRVTHRRSGRITQHPEVTLGSLGEFETRPDWVPVMDKGQQFARIAEKLGKTRGQTGRNR
jgi:hypothetical protein